MVMLFLGNGTSETLAPKEGLGYDITFDDYLNTLVG